MVDAGVLTQDDPAGPYFNITVDEAYADAAVDGLTRVKAVVPMDAEGVVLGPAITADEVDAYADEPAGDGGFTFEVAQGFADQYSGDFAVLCPVAAGRLAIQLSKEAVTTLAVEVPASPGLARVSNDDPDPIALTYPVPTPLVTKDGNSLIVAVAWKPGGGGITVTNVQLGGAHDGTALSTTTIGGAGGYKLAVWEMVDLPATNTTPSLPLPLIEVTFSAQPTKAIAVAIELKTLSPDPDDVAVTGSGSDYWPTTDSSADTATANEPLMAFLLVSGASFAAGSLPSGPDGFAQVSDYYTHDAVAANSEVTLYAYTKNIIAIDNVGFAATLSASRDWAVALHSFQ